MKMEIIAKGKLPDEDLFKGSCHNCKSVMRFKRGEAKQVIYDQREFGEVATATCPVCAKEFYGYPERG